MIGIWDWEGALIQELRYVGWEHYRHDPGSGGADLAEIVDRASRGIEDLGEELVNDRLGRSTVWRCVTSRQLTAPTVEHLCRELGLNGDWLMLGRAPAVEHDAREGPDASRLGGLVRELGRRSASVKPQVGGQRWARALA